MCFQSHRPTNFPPLLAPCSPQAYPQPHTLGWAKINLLYLGSFSTLVSPQPPAALRQVNNPTILPWHKSHLFFGVHRLSFFSTLKIPLITKDLPQAEYRPTPSLPGQLQPSPQAARAHSFTQIMPSPPYLQHPTPPEGEPCPVLPTSL